MMNAKTKKTRLRISLSASNSLEAQDATGNMPNKICCKLTIRDTIRGSSQKFNIINSATELNKSDILNEKNE